MWFGVWSKLDHFEAMNSFPIVSEHCFKHSSNLMNLHLISNNVTLLESHAFANLDKLKFLNLSDNYLLYLPDNMLSSNTSLKTLSLLNNTLDNNDVNVFYQFSVGYIETDDFRICCLASERTTCNVSKPWYSSCHKLIPSSTIQVYFIKNSVIIFLLAVVSGILIIIQPRQTAAKIFPFCVNVVEIVHTFYLGIVWISDLQYKDKFVMEEQTWRSSFACHSASTIFLFFTTADPVVLLVLSLSRLMVVWNPFDSKFKNTEFVSRAAVFVLVPSLLGACLVGFILFFVQNMLSTSICVHVVDPTKSAISATILTASVTALHIAATAAIATVHCLLVHKVNKSKISKSVSKSSTSLVVQLVVVTSTQIVCWIPANILYLICLIVPQYPPELVIWTTVLLVPINSIVNPIVFIFTSIRAIREK